MENKDTNKIDLCLSSFTCETNFSILEKVFFDFGLREYFNLFNEYYGIKRTFGDNGFEVFSSMPKNVHSIDVFQKAHEHFRFTALLYEGSIHSKLSYEETQLVLLYGLFSGMDKHLFCCEIHDKVKEQKQIHPEKLEKVLSMISLKSFKNSCDLHAVIIDAREMFVYWCDINHPALIKRVTDHSHKVPCADMKLVIDYVFTKFKQTTWKTKWAKMKSFNRNHPAVCEKLRKDILKKYSLD